MSETILRTQNRRESFRSLARMCVLGGMGVMAGALVKRRTAAPAGRQTCTQDNGVCRGCPTLAVCGLPQALSMRAASDRRTETAKEALR